VSVSIWAVSPGELVERAPGAVLPLNGFGVGQSFRTGHDRVVNRSHLRGQHDLDLIPRLDPFVHRKHEIEQALVNLTPRELPLLSC
jgi:hypothetical protein